MGNPLGPRQLFPISPVNPSLLPIPVTIHHAYYRNQIPRYKDRFTAQWYAWCMYLLLTHCPLLTSSLSVRQLGRITGAEIAATGQAVRNDKSSKRVEGRARGWVEKSAAGA